MAQEASEVARRSVETNGDAAEVGWRDVGQIGASGARPLRPARQRIGTPLPRRTRLHPSPGRKPITASPVSIVVGTIRALRP